MNGSPVSTTRTKRVEQPGGPGFREELKQAPADQFLAGHAVDCARGVVGERVNEVDNRPVGVTRRGEQHQRTGFFSSSDGQRSPPAGGRQPPPLAGEFAFQHGAFTLVNLVTDQYSQYGTKSSPSASAKPSTPRSDPAHPRPKAWIAPAPRRARTQEAPAAHRDHRRSWPHR